MLWKGKRVFLWMIEHYVELAWIWYKHFRNRQIHRWETVHTFEKTKTIWISLNICKPSQHVRSPSDSVRSRTFFHGETGWQADRLSGVTLRATDCASSSKVEAPESDLTEVPAMHTIEMIPKSMILTSHMNAPKFMKFRIKNRRQFSSDKNKIGKMNI